MTTYAPAFSVNDRELYPLHEEDDVPETELHDLLVDYLCDALRARFPHWRVCRNVAIYWERGNTNLYRAPDVFVVKEPIPQPDLRVYHTWQDPPVLFAAEVGSRSTFREDEGPKAEVYARFVQTSEYLYFDPAHSALHLWQLEPSGVYIEVAPEANGRLRSAELGLEFGVEAGFLRAYTPEGERLRSHREAEWDREAAEARAAEEAERRTTAERERAAAEARAKEEAERRTTAEQERTAAEERAAEERTRREEVERQLAALQAERNRRNGAADTGKE